MNKGKGICSSSHCGSGPSDQGFERPLSPNSPMFVTTKFLVAGMDCGDEVSAIKNALHLPEVSAVNANIMAATVEVSHLPALSAEAIKSKIESTGVKVSESLDHKPSLMDKNRLALILISGVLLAVGFLVQFLLPLKNVLPIVFGASTLFGGALVFPKAWRAIRQFQLDMNVLMTVAVIGAFLVQEYSEAATVVFLFSLAELLEAYSVARARVAIRQVLNLTPQKANLIASDGAVQEIPLESVKIGDRILVKTGDRIPVDGEVTKGSSLVNQAPLTGESIPVEKAAGDKVFAGTINDTGVLEIRALALFTNSKVSQIIRMIEDAQKAKAPSERFVDSFSKIYTPVVFLLAVLTFALPPLLWGGEWNNWFYRSLVLLVIACPCTLVISTPVSIVSGLTAMARRGVLVKGGAFLEALGRVKAIAMDKTGTITEGKPRVQKILLVNNFSEEEVLRVAASIESLSSHPLAQAVVEHARELSIPLKTATDFRTIVGKGAEAKVGDHEYFLGNHRFAHELGVCGPELESQLASLEQQAYSVIVVGHRPHHDCVGEVFGIIALGDTIRANAKKAISDLHGSGVDKVIMLSGDNPKTVSAIASQAGIDEAIGDLLPDDKVTRVKSLVKEYKFVAMIGDGVNDAPALAQATVGIAMGGIGTDTAIETSDVTLMQDDLEQVAEAVKMGKRALSIIRFNIGFALTTKFIFLALAIFGSSNLWFAVLADTGASVLVTLNALRLIGGARS